MLTAQALLVRPARQGDLEHLALLEEASFVDSWPHPLLDYELTHPYSLLLVASWGEGQAPVGYISFRYVTDESELLRLAVDPDQRRRGIARALVEHGFDLLRRRGIASCHLEVRMDNEAALAFYRDLGFARTGRRRHYYRDGSDAITLARSLRPLEGG